MMMTSYFSKRFNGRFVGFSDVLLSDEVGTSDKGGEGRCDFVSGFSSVCMELASSL